MTAPASKLRGIGPVCSKKYIKARTILEQEGLGNPCKVCKKPVPYFPNFSWLRLPCNHYCCLTGHCPFAGKETCPRERVIIKTDIYPLYKKKERRCSFCGKIVINQYIKTFSRTKLIIECYECRKENKLWRK